MARHHLDPAPRALHGYFSRELAPALTIDSGDVVSFQTLDAGWGAIEQEAGFSEPRDYIPRDLARDVAHPLAGPVAINGARAGMTLEIRINRIRTGRWGWSAGPGAPAQLDPHLGLGPGPGGPPAVITVPRGDQATFWELDPEGAIGINRLGQRLKLRPFMGIMGMPLDQPGIQSTFPPTRVWRQSRLPRANGRHGAVSADRSRWRVRGVHALLRDDSIEQCTEPKA
jgi:acetamidase/formamidase